MTLIFGTSYHVIGALLAKLVENLVAVGLQLNVDKSKILTSQAQPPQRLQTPSGLTISIIDQESSCKWLGCMLTTALGNPLPAMLTTGCNQHRKFSTQIGGYFVTFRLPLQRGWNTLTVSYRAGHRTIYKNVLMFYNAVFLRSVVGPPRNIDWTLPWHQILHQWNGRIQTFMG